MSAVFVFWLYVRKGSIRKTVKVAAIIAGFVIIPTAFGASVDVQKGPSLIFGVMTDIFGRLPGGRLIGAFFFAALVFAVISSLFSFVEITARIFEIHSSCWSYC
jgi:NSS family neurotransmitter:Na+ symporter